MTFRCRSFSRWRSCLRILSDVEVGNGIVCFEIADSEPGVSVRSFQCVAGLRSYVPWYLGYIRLNAFTRLKCLTHLISTKYEQNFDTFKG